MVSIGVRRGSKFFLILLSCTALLRPLPGQTKPAKAAAAIPDYVHNVYPFLGVDWGGNTFVGAAVPFGMVKVGPDMQSFDGRASTASALSRMEAQAKMVGISVARSAKTSCSFCPQ